MSRRQRGAEALVEGLNACERGGGWRGGEDVCAVFQVLPREGAMRAQVEYEPGLRREAKKGYEDAQVRNDDSCIVFAGIAVKRCAQGE